MAEPLRLQRLALVVDAGLRAVEADGVETRNEKQPEMTLVGGAAPCAEAVLGAHSTTTIVEEESTDCRCCRHSVEIGEL